MSLFKHSRTNLPPTAPLPPIKVKKNFPSLVDNRIHPMEIATPMLIVQTVTTPSIIQPELQPEQESEVSSESSSDSSDSTSSSDSSTSDSSISDSSDPTSSDSSDSASSDLSSSPSRSSDGSLTPEEDPNPTQQTLSIDRSKTESTDSSDSPNQLLASASTSASDSDSDSSSRATDSQSTTSLTTASPPRMDHPEPIPIPDSFVEYIEAGSADKANPDENVTENPPFKDVSHIHNSKTTSRIAPESGSPSNPELRDQTSHLQVPNSEATLPSPSQLSCLLCANNYRGDRFELSCCKKNTCLKCIAIWFIHYGKTCPFCNITKSECDLDIERIMDVLVKYPKLLELVAKKCPTRRIHTNPLLPQTGISDTNTSGTGTVNTTANPTDNPVPNPVPNSASNPGQHSTVITIGNATNGSNSENKCCCRSRMFKIIIYLLIAGVCLSIITIIGVALYFGFK